jgi:hypothetical protein
MLRRGGRLRRCGIAGRESRTGPLLTIWEAFDSGLGMPRKARIAPGGLVCHVLNRGAARMQLLEKPADYQAFEQVWSYARRRGGGRACGGAFAVRARNDRRWRLGRLTSHRTGLSWSIEPMTRRNLEALRRSLHGARPFGQMEWQKRIAKRLGLQSAYRPGGHPRKARGSYSKQLCGSRMAPHVDNPQITNNGPRPAFAFEGYLVTRSVVSCECVFAPD